MSWVILDLPGVIFEGKIMTTANEQIVDTLSIENLKTVGGASAAAHAGLAQVAAQSLGLAMQNAVTNQQSLNAINQAATTVAVNKLLNMDAAEALAVVKANTGNDLASQMQALLAALNGGQQGVKSAQTTPPETGK